MSSVLRRLSTVSLVAWLAFVFAGCSDRGVAAETQIQLADGSTTQFSHWDERWVLINYWAEWCAPCRKEIPELNRLHGDRNATGVVVVGVNYDGLNADKLRPLIKELGIRFPVMLEDPRLRWNADQPSVLPSTLLIGPDGQLKDVLVGPQTYESFSRAMQLTTST
jgi:thiol-disulfide isomerase/thioredoxin